MNFGIWEQTSSAEIELIAVIKESEPFRSSTLEELERNISCNRFMSSFMSFDAASVLPCRINVSNWKKEKI